MSDRDRDELIQAIAHPDMRTPVKSVRPPSCTPCNKAEQVADQLLAAGWRKTETLPVQESAGRLTTCPAHPGHAPFLAAHSCPWCTITKLQAGRDVVTPEQVVEAAKAIEAVEAQSTHTTFAMARAALYSVGLFVAEGETT